MNPKTFDTDKSDPLVCPSCQQKIIQAAGVTPGHSGSIRKGGLFVCASCGNASIVGDSKLEPLTQEKFNALPTNVQQALNGIIGTLKDMSVTNTELN